MRVRFFTLVPVLTALLACGRSSAVLVLDARVNRETDNRVSADIELEGVDEAGGNAGHYCVSVHWFDVGFDPNTIEQNHYVGELDSAEQCESDLSDGDRRTYRLFSTRNDLGSGLPMRVQTSQNGVFRTKQGLFSP